jgi:hypothetical protein
MVKENEMTFEMSFIPNREVRWIPKGWQHPKDAKGRYVPLLPNGYCDANGFTDEEKANAREMPSTTGAARAQGLEIAAYETTTEGTPISPAFPDTPEGRLALVNWCAENETTFGDHKADAEAWAGILLTDQVVTVDPEDGSVRIA